MKKLIILFTILFLITDIAYCWELYSPASLRYLNNGTYESIYNRNNRMYANDYERNKYEQDKYYCMIPKGDTTGYLVTKRKGVTGYVWQEFMRVPERVKCNIHDETPIVRSWTELKNK